MESIMYAVSTVSSFSEAPAKDTSAPTSSLNATSSKTPARPPPVVSSGGYAPDNKATSNSMNASPLSATDEQRAAMTNVKQALSNMKAVYAGTGLKAPQALLGEVTKATENAKSSESTEEPKKDKDGNDIPFDAEGIKDEEPVTHTPLTDEELKEMYAIDRITVLGHNGRLYSTLPPLRDSAKAFKDLKASEVLDKEIGKLFLRHAVVNELAACLIHNHFDIEYTEQLVTIGNTSIPISMDIDTGSPIGPLSFRFVDTSNKIPGLEAKSVYVGPYESIQLEKGETPFSIREHSWGPFLLDYYKVLKEHGLLNVLGFCVRDKPVQSTPGEKPKHKMEYTAGKANIVMELEGEPEPGKSTEAVWTFDVIEPVKKSQYDSQSLPRYPTVMPVIQEQHKLEPIDRTYGGPRRSVVMGDSSDEIICVECTKHLWAMQGCKECYPQPNGGQRNCEHYKESAVHTATTLLKVEVLDHGPEYISIVADSGKRDARVWKEGITYIDKAAECPYINDNEKLATMNSSSFEETVDKLGALSTGDSPALSPSWAPNATDCTKNSEFQPSRGLHDKLNIAVIADEEAQFMRGGAINDTEALVGRNCATRCSNGSNIGEKYRHHYGRRQRPDHATEGTLDLSGGALNMTP